MFEQVQLRMESPFITKTLVIKLGKLCATDTFTNEPTTLD